MCHLSCQVQLRRARCWLSEGKRLRRKCLLQPGVHRGTRRHWQPATASGRGAFQRHIRPQGAFGGCGDGLGRAAARRDAPAANQPLRAGQTHKLGAR